MTYGNRHTRHSRLAASGRTASLTVVGGALLLTSAGCRRTAVGGASLPASPPASSASATGLRFVDVADASGIGGYRWVATGKRPLNILQTIGCGCAFLDFDNDGNLDILLVGPKLALYRGDGHGHFTDVTHRMGLDAFHGDFRGCAVGDYDNDGYEDVYISAYRGGILLHNERGNRFVDATRTAGIAAQPWGSSCAFVDVDGDGWLDLYVGNYVHFTPQTQPRLCPAGDAMTACGPRYYAAERGVLYRNLGGRGRFQDITTAWGAARTSGKVLGVAAADFDGSGKQSILLANDEVPGDLLKNQGHGFENIGLASGTACDVSGNPHGGMGADWGDYDGDGRLDLALMTYQREPKCIYHNDGNSVFSERSSTLGMPSSLLPNVAFGVKWLDADNDGWLDLLIANGHVEDNAEAIDHNTAYRQRSNLFRNEQGASFTDAGAGLTGDADRPIVGRGLAIGDYDNDGKIDALIVDAEGKPLLLHNETPNAGHWLELSLVGTKSNRDGQGALVTVDTGGRKLLRQCTTGGSYLSASDKRIHIGLGAAGGTSTLTVRWPDGHVDIRRNVLPDRILTLREGDTSPLPGAAAGRS